MKYGDAILLTAEMCNMNDEYDCMYGYDDLVLKSCVDDAKTFSDSPAL